MLTIAINGALKEGIDIENYNDYDFEELDDEDEFDDEEEEEIEEKPRRGWLKKSEPKNIEEPVENIVDDIDDDDDLEILDLDLDDL